METVAVVLVIGLFAQPGLCQINPAMLAMMSGGGAGGRGFNPMALGMAGAEMGGGGMQDLMMMQALSGAGGGGAGGAMDPMTMMMLGGGAGGGNDMMQQMMLMNMLRGNSGSSSGGSQGGQPQGVATNIANMLAGPGGITNADLTPGQQNALWGVVSMSGNSQRIMDAISAPADKIALERDGLQGLNPMMTMSMCPRPTQCTFAYCENPEMAFTPDTFYVCRGCPRCPMDPAQRNMMNMMSSMGGAGGAGGAGGSMRRFPMV